MAFTMFDKISDIIDKLPDDGSRALFAYACERYGNRGEEVELPFPLDACFAGIREDIDNSCGRRGAGKAGGRPKKARNLGKPQDVVVSENGKPQDENCENQVSENGKPQVSKTENQVSPKAETTFPETGKPPFPKTENPSQANTSQANTGQGEKDTEKDAAGLPGAEEQEADARFAFEAIEAFNRITGKDVGYPPPRVFQDLARIRGSGRTIADVEAVVRRKHAQWAGDAKMARHIRPSTLFSAEHFEEYLNELDPSEGGEEPWE